MSGSETIRSHQSGRRGVLSEIDLLNLIYIAWIIAVIAVCHSRIGQWPACLAAYAGLAAGLLTFLVATARSGQPVIVFARAWYTPLLFIFHYEFAFLLNQAIAPLYLPWVGHLMPDAPPGVGQLGARVYFDPLMMDFDQWLFGFQPGVEFARALPAGWFNELMHLAYFSFYAYIPVVGGMLWFRGRRREFDDLLFRATFTILVCDAIFVLFPVAGPYYYMGLDGFHHEGGFVFTWIMRTIIARLDVPNGGFPSSHVAVALVVLVSAYFYEKRLFVWLIVPFVGLCVSTVYVAQHYAVDTLAGLLAGPLLYMAAPLVLNTLGSAAEGVTTGKLYRATSQPR